ncbi:MAG: long-chain fatty acid--CoA ligase [Candidatus Eisenbacteria bacterium]
MAATLIQLFYDCVARYPRPDMFQRRVRGAWEPLSSERVVADVESFGLALRDLGVKPGDRVALLAENRYEWALADLAILGQGAVTVPIYPTLIAEQIRFILDNAEATVAIVSTAAQLAKLRAAAPVTVKTVIHMDPVPDESPLDRDFGALVALGAGLRSAAPEAFRSLAAAVQPDDLATIIYTSGTTGEPKGAMLTHANIESNCRACWERVTFRAGDLALSFLPLCHIFERMGGFYALIGRGVGIAYAESIETVAANAVEVKPHILCGVPRFFEKVYARVMENVGKQPPLRRSIFHWGLAQGQRAARAHFERRALPPHHAIAARIADRLVGAKVRERVGGRLRFCISGGAPLSPKVMEFFFAIGIPIYEGYGLTETSPVICLNVPGREKPGSVGPAVDGVEVRIGEQGEILTRGPHVMKGYFRNEAATRATIREGWFHTGDVGRLDEDGALWITDRLKDLLVTAGGKKVAPQPLEASLKTSKWVSEAILLGDQHPYVVALLVPNFANLEAEARARGWTFVAPRDLLGLPAVRALYQAEIDRLNARLAPFEQIKNFALLDRELSQEAGELTPTLKVRRRIITQRFSSIIRDLYARPSGERPV